MLLATDTNQNLRHLIPQVYPLGIPTSNKGMWQTRVCLFLLGTRKYRGAGKSLARPGRKQATTTEDFDFDVSYL